MTSKEASHSASFFYALLAASGNAPARSGWISPKSYGEPNSLIISTSSMAPYDFHLETGSCFQELPAASGNASYACWNSLNSYGEHRMTFS